MDQVPLPPLPPQPPLPPVSPSSQAPQLPRKTFIDTLQSLEEPMKGRLLIAASVVMMVVVVYVWIGYFNNIVMSNPATQLADESAVAPTDAAPAASLPAITQPSAPGFWAEFGSAFVSMYHGMVNSFRAPKQYDITPTK